MRGSAFAPVLLAAAACAASLACAPAQPAQPAPAVVTAPPAATATEAAADAPPARTAPDVPCDLEAMPPLDVVAGNIVATELTALGTIAATRVTGTDGSEPPPRSGYVHFLYEVDVLDQFAGDHVAHLRLVQGAEAGIKPQRPGTLFFFSACKSEDGSAYEPDVGYFFPVGAGCRKQVAQIAAKGAAEAADGGDRGSACRD